MTRATIATEIGDIEVDLFDSAAPKATKNFVDLANKGFYDDVIFHRVIPGFVIQGDYERGALAMANAGPNTNGSQFFICTADLTGRLPKNYTLFGQVTKGLDVVDRIVSAPRDARDLPNEPVAMTSVTIHPDEG